MQHVRFSLISVDAHFPDEAARAAAEKELEEMIRNAPPSRSSYFGIFDLISTLFYDGKLVSKTRKEVRENQMKEQEERKKLLFFPCFPGVAGN